MPRIHILARPARYPLVGLLVALPLVVAGLSYAASPPTLMTLLGTGAGDRLGCSVRAAGDVNGDGYDDVIVGAYRHAADAGAAYVYFGGPGADAVADLTLPGAAAGDYFGWSVGTAGDVNHDGYDDLIVGAYGNDAGGAAAGRAYVYLGGASPNAVADMTITGVAASDWLGYTVGTAGDVNGDGYDDVIVGAYGNDAGGSNAGRAYVFFGGASPDATADLTLTGAAASDWFGYAVGAAGDVNGDGYGDVIVGARYNDAGGTDAGRAYVFYGGASPNAVADLTLTGLAAGESFGRAVGTAGDVDGDGYADVIVGAYLSDAGGADAGRAYLFYGGASTDQTADVVYSGEAAGNYFGYAVGAAGDVNGDGYDDVAVAAYRNGAAGTDAGRAYVYYGGDSPDNTADITLTGAAASDAFGVAVGCVGDVNGDGHPDLAVGATGNDAGGTDAGAAYVYDVGPPPAAACRLAQELDPGTTMAYGMSVGGAGDMNADGYADVIVGDPFMFVMYDPLNSYYAAGVASIYTGGSWLDVRWPAELEGEAEGDHLGASVAGAGDVNGDGYDDAIAGVPGHDAAGTDAGRAYVCFGGAYVNSGPDWTLTGAAAYDEFGAAVGAAGDVNGDGYADIIVGAPQPSGNGRAYVFYGGASPDAVADLVLTGAATGDGFGCSAGTAGDVNGDGYGDVIVGASGNDAGGTDAGRAYVYYGGPGADATADLVLTGAAAGDGFGRSAGTAGDVNGDGYGDVIVTAYRNDAGGTDAGRAYIYYGAPAADAVADLVLTGAAAGDAFGYSAGTARDVNGDGYGDVIVGAMGAERAYVYLGGPAPDAVADQVVSGSWDVVGFGASVAGTGDVHGDGFPDVVVGAPFDYLAKQSVSLFDFQRYFVLSPNGGEIWSIGATKSVSWLGAERADVWISLDAGGTYDLLAHDVGGADSNSITVTAPGTPSTHAWIRVTPADPKTSGSDRSDAVFTIRDPAGVGPTGPGGLALRAPWPNPASGVVRLGIELPRECVVTLSVFDLAGREVARPIAAERFAAGSVAREWRPAGLAPGVYTMRAAVGDVKLTQRLVWLGGR
jgi:hypothetical protein